MANSSYNLNRKRKGFACTDLGNAERLVRDHRRDIRYCHALDQWYIWDDIRWACDKTGELQRRAKDTVVGIFTEAANARTDVRRKDLATWAINSQSERAINAMIRLAQSEPGIAITPSDFDQNPYQLNVINGTVNLRTGKLHRHLREDYITKLAPVRYEPKASDVIWERVLHDATGGDAELREVIQRAFGYSATGDTGEEVLFMVHGPAASSKSTITEAIKSTLGDYALTADFETFLKRRATGGPRNDIARLAGSRLVISIEVDEGETLAEGLVKTLTGGDAVAARKLYKEAFEFKPNFKLCLVANHAPKVKAGDGAMWRRIRVIPLTQQVPPHLRDPKVKAHLTNPAKAGPAILQFLIKGSLAWQQGGLKIPAIVQEATDAYRASQDSFGDFISECCVLDSNAWVSTKDLRGEFDNWSTERGDNWLSGETLSGKAFADQLKALGLQPKKGTGGIRGWSGIRLDVPTPPNKTPADDSQAEAVH